MTYTHIKANGRVVIFKDGEFHHQQFRGHWWYSNPQGYIEHLIQCDREAAEYAAECAAARRAEVDDMGHANSHTNGGGHAAVAFAIQERATSENLNHGPQGKGYQADVAYTLEARSEVKVTAYSIMPMNSGKDYKARETDVAQPIMAGAPGSGNQGGDYILQSAVRHLTPRECERLQGFPDDYSLVPNRGKPAADGPRYKALGNSMAVPVMAWIGERIQMMEIL